MTAKPETPASFSLVVLISGRGSNLAALIDATRHGTLPARIAAVVSNEPEARGLGLAAEAGIETVALPHRAYASRSEFDAALADTIDRFSPDLVVLAGFMRILGEELVGRYLGRMINIHPSLLPRHPGLDTHRRAIEAGDAVHGATVHFVTPDLDAGPTIIQAEVPVLAGDDEQVLAARVLEREHQILPTAVAWIASGRARMEGGRTLIDGRPLDG